MVNNALKDLIFSGHGESVWRRISDRAGVDEEVFLSNESYPDDTTYRLVAAAAVELEIPAEQVLHSFGRWWVLQTGRNCYGHLLEGGGRTLRQFLMNLPNFHTRVMMVFPDLKPPEFECTEPQQDTVRLDYRSHRPGLASFVMGLLDGLSEMYQTRVAINHHQRADDGADHDVFLITWLSTASPSP